MNRAVVGYLILLAFVLAGFVRVEFVARDARDLAETQKRDSRERIDQSCTLFERDHLTDVQRLRNTYRYLAQLRPSEVDQPLNRFVIRALPETEREARQDTAPRYCDEPGLGLPEPDPVIPQRPQNLPVP